MRKNGLWVAVAVLALPAAGFAQPEDPARESQDNEAVIVKEEKPHKEKAKRFNVAVQGGATTYAGRGAEFTQPGAAYGAVVSGAFLPWAALEVGYLGSAYRTERTSLSEQRRATIMENGGQANLKLGAPGIHFPVKPYAVGGVAAGRLNVIQDAEAQGLVKDSTTVRFPLGVGFEITPSGSPLLIGARGTYALSANNNAFPETGKNNAEATWTGLASVGGAF